MTSAHASAPMPFSALQLKNVRCFKQTRLPLDPRMTVIIGENGAGKTTVAEALGSLAYGKREGLARFPLRRRARQGHIRLQDEPHAPPIANWTVRGEQEIRERLPDERYLFAYGRYRRVHTTGDLPSLDEPEPRQRPLEAIELLSDLMRAALHRRTTSLTRPDGYLLKNLSRYLVAIHEGRQHDPQWEALWRRLDRSLRELKQGLQRIEIEEGEYEYIPVVIRHGVKLGIDELSDGYQAVLVIVFDLLIRYATLFAQSKKPWEGPATVVIDEIDLHLHVRWQRTVLAQLTTLFPNTQFIVTTHSPAVVQGAIDEGYPVVVLRERKGAVTARTLGPRTRERLQGADIGSLIVERELFGVPSRYSARYQGYEEEIARIRGRIESGRDSEEDRRRLTELFRLFERLMVDEEERRADGAFLSDLVKLRTAFLEDLADRTRGD